jgi:hypothetical protein
MKKQAKKLVLSKETVRGLERLTLNKVAGGTTLTLPDTYYKYCKAGELPPDQS